MKINDAISIAIRVCIESALKQSSGNVRQAAKEIGVCRSQLYRLAAKHGVQIKPPRRLSVVPELAEWRRP